MHRFWGKVKKGKNRGKALGFPTANVRLHKEIPEGIYISMVKIAGKKHPSLTFIGIAKTFNDKEYLSESYILNFDQELYSKWISVELMQKIRSNKKFRSEKELVVQMELDKKEAEKFFNISR